MDLDTGVKVLAFIGACFLVVCFFGVVAMILQPAKKPIDPKTEAEKRVADAEWLAEHMDGVQVSYSGEKAVEDSLHTTKSILREYAGMKLEQLACVSSQT